MIAEAEADGRARRSAEYGAFMASQGRARRQPEPAAAAVDPAQPCAPWATSSSSPSRASSDAVGETFDDRRDVLDPGPGADLNRPPRRSRTTA